MESLVDDGLVKAIGISNCSMAQIDDLVANCRIVPAVHQMELHPFLAQHQFVAELRRKGIQPVAYSPLGGQSAYVENNLRTHPTLLKVAEQAGKSPVQMLLRWNLQRGVAVIPMADNEAHLRANREGMFDWQLTEDQVQALDSLECGKRFVTFDWKRWGAAPVAQAGGVANHARGGFTFPHIATATQQYPVAARAKSSDSKNQ